MGVGVCSIYSLQEKYFVQTHQWDISKSLLGAGHVLSVGRPWRTEVEGPEHPRPRGSEGAAQRV